MGGSCVKLKGKKYMRNFGWKTWWKDIACKT